MSTRFRHFITLLPLLLLSAGPAQSFEFIGSKWPTSSVTVNADIASFFGEVSPSGIPWNQAFQEAANSWNATTTFRINVADSFSNPCAGIDFASNNVTGNNQNGVDFTNNLCGNLFGLGTLAVTITLFELGNSDETAEADVVFNRNESWDVYNGPWRGNASDFRRVAAHELGHVIGLDHEDSVPALMATFVTFGSTIETPQADDINGVNILYGDAALEPIVMQLEEPVAGEAKTGVANLRGWAVALGGINRVELTVDGVSRGNIPIGGRRVDVADDFPTYPNAAESGFSMAFNYSELSAGNHNVVVRAFDNVGNSLQQAATFTVVRFDNSFIGNPASVSLSNATINNNDPSITILNLQAEGQFYDVIMQWRTATQSFEIIQIQ
ncbi:MAG: matrixin family metalloprotease [Candidatus Competibacteraceae bacterium]